MKILDLFNEYNLSPEMTGGEMEQPRTEKDWNTMSRIYKAYIVSKDFGWIKWLVYNDKIDHQKAPGEIMFDDRMGTTFSLEDSIVMMLSISDTPIQDLCKYLK